MGRLKTQEEYLQEVRAVHKNFYSYPNLNYTRAHDKIRIECPIHGEFCQSANSHLRGTGCPKCGSVKKGKTKRLNLLSKRPDLSHIETPEGSKAVPVGTKGDYALVDEEDYDRVMEYNWYLSGGGYAFSRIGGSIIAMHRFLFKDLKDMHVDHRTGNTLDNRRINLRRCYNSDNSKNRVSGGGTSKFKGVYWNKRQSKWHSSIMVDYRSIHLGYFTDEIEAARAYDKAAKKYHKDFARLNFPKGTASAKKETI